MAKNPDEQRLVDSMVRYQQGEMEAFTSLYETMRQPLQRYLWTFVRNAATAEDLLQDTFYQVHRARHTYTPPRPVKPWLYAISRHVALMHLRTMRRRKESLAYEELPEIPVPPAMEAIGDRATLAKLLTQIPVKGREILVLHHILGLSFQEIGQIMGLAAGTAKVRAHRALKSLRQIAEEQRNIS